MLKRSFVAAAPIQAPVFRKAQNVVQWINLDPVYKSTGFPNTYPLDSDLSGGYSVTHLLNNWGQNNYLYEICVMGNLLLNDVIQESQALETRPSGPTIAVGFSE